MIVSSLVVGGVTCGYAVGVLSFEVTGVSGGAARCGGQASGLPSTTLPRRGRGGSQVQGGACAIA